MSVTISAAFRSPRIALTAGQLTEVTPPFLSTSVSIGNAGSNDIRVYTTLDRSEYLVIAAGWERAINLTGRQQPPSYERNFAAGIVAFWLEAQVSDNVAVLLWL